MYRPSELHKFLKKWGIKPKKGLSQNFLIDGNIVEKMARAASVGSGDVVLEIGPGPGAITKRLLEEKAHIIAVEKDPVLACHLRELNGPLEVYAEDILTFDFSKNLDPLITNKKAKVIANLPYHITTPIVTKLVQMPSRFDFLLIMVQHEMAKRMTGEPKSEDYGSLTLFLKYHAEVEYLFKVKSTCFYPVPKVDSAVVKIQLRDPPDVSNPEVFLKFIKKVFGQRRKMLRKSLSGEFSSAKVDLALKSLNLNPKARPEELSLDEFISLFEWLAQG